MSILLELGLLVMLLPQTAPKQGYSVHGSVSFDNGFRFKPVLVYLEPLSSRPVATVQSDQSGNFTFTSVLEGTYYVRVKLEGFEETAQRIDVPAFDRPVTLVLQRKVKEPIEVELSNGIEFEQAIHDASVPENAADEYLKAIDEDKQGKISGAISRLQRVLNLAPTFVQASFRLGSFLYKAGQFEQAEKVLVRGLKTIPKEPHLRLMLTNVFLRQHKYDLALRQLDAYLEENPNGPERFSAQTTRAQLVEAISDN